MINYSYADNELRLTYKGGMKCKHNYLRRQTIITFKCKKDAGNFAFLSHFFSLVYCIEENMFYTPLPSFFIFGGGGGVDSWVFRQIVEHVVYW